MQTDLGGEGARLTIEQRVPAAAGVIERRSGEPGLAFVDYRDQVVPW